jgi:hypothetical protein
MPAGGYVRAYRQIQDHPLGAKEPACPRWAWVDLIMLAAWEPHFVHVKAETVLVDRGDVVASIRFLMRRWRWGSGRTQRFVRVLERDRMVIEKRHGSGHGSPSIFSIVNYDLYQRPDDSGGTGSGTGSGTVAARLRHETKKGKKVKKTTTTSPACLFGSNSAGSETPWGTPEALVALYNASVPGGHPKVTTLTVGRRKNARASLNQFPAREFWAAAFAEIARSSFLRGRRPSPGHENFRADLDWLLAKGKDGTENAVKVAEGKYRDAAPVPGDDDDDTP